MTALDIAIQIIAESDSTSIPKRYNDHALKGNLKHCRALHLESSSSDWLVVYTIDDEESVVKFIATGKHDEVF